MKAAGAGTQTRLWHAAGLGAALLRGRFSGFAYDLHTHDTACLALITRGAIRIRMRGGSFVAQAGDLYAIDAEEPHAGWPVDETGWSQRTIYVDLAALAARVGVASGAMRGPIIRDPALTASFLAVHRACERDGAMLLRDERYLEFARLLFGRHVGGSAFAGCAAPAVRRARAFLDAHLNERVSLAEVAAAAGLPPYQIYRAFERSFAMTPHHYQRQARVRVAAGLIRRGVGLAEVAAAAGFADQAHLTRSFQSRMGVTPGAYRAAWG